MKRLTKEQKENLKRILDEAYESCKEELDQCPNERTYLKSLEKIFETIEKRKPTEEEQKDSKYKRTFKQYDKACDAWRHVAYQYRVGDRVSIAKAELALAKAIDNF